MSEFSSRVRKQGNVMWPWRKKIRLLGWRLKARISEVPVPCTGPARLAEIRSLNV